MNLNLTPKQVFPIRPNILVVEDEMLVRLMLCEILRDAGYNVIEAYNGDEAVKILSESIPDLIITDVRMPGSVDGIQLMAKVRETNTDLPIIITSAHLDHVKNLANGPTYFLPKPYEFNRVIELIENELSH